MYTLEQPDWALEDEDCGDSKNSSSREDHEEPFPLLHLPDPCLVAVLQCCADKPRSLFSAARAHSRLHQADVLAASSIRVTESFYTFGYDQRQLNSMLLYLDNHGQQVSSLEFDKIVGFDCLLWLLDKLPGLSSLTISRVDARLQHHAPSGSRRIGVKELGTALAALSGLQHLSIQYFDSSSFQSPWTMDQQYALMSILERDECLYDFPSDALQGLQQLTYLELVNFGLQDKDGLRHLQGLTCLQDLRLLCCSAFTIDSSMLSNSQQLTCLELCAQTELPEEVSCKFQPDVLAGRTQLQHLKLIGCTIGSGTFWGSKCVPELLSHLQQMQQLTALSLRESLQGYGFAPASAYSVLTASSKLQHLDLNNCRLPERVWEYVFREGRKLPHLQELDISGFSHPDSAGAPPEGSSLVCCCPGLRSLQMLYLQGSAEVLAPLTGLTGLRDLSLGSTCAASTGLEVVCQLTGLERLRLADHAGPATRGMVLQLSQLQRLTHLDLYAFIEVECRVQEDDDEPVWRQVMQHILKRVDPATWNDPELAQQAAAALEHNKPEDQPFWF